MKKAIALILAMLLTTLVFVSCVTKEPLSQEQVAGHYMHKYGEWESFGDHFSIDLNADGTYSYYETYISSHIGMGNYSIHGDVITLTDELPGVDGTVTRFYRFRYVDDKLVFLAEKSGSFTYVDLPDGTVFDCYELSDFHE